MQALRTKKTFHLKILKRFYSTQQAQQAPNKNAILYCRDSVRRSDYEHFYCSLFYGRTPKVATWGVRAFNIETATIKNSVTKIENGLIRFRWWRETLDKIYKGNPPEHPVATVLHDSLKQVRLTKGWFIRLLDAREKDLETFQPRTLQDLETYAENTWSSLLYLTLESLNIRNVNADHAASHLGKATGLIVLIRAIPYHCKSKQVYLPMELTLKHGVSQEQLFRGEVNSSVNDVVYEIANLAKSHLEHSRQIQEIPKNAHLGLLSAAYMDNFLVRLQKCDFNPFDSKLIQRPVMPQLVILKNYWKGVY